MDAGHHWRYVVGKLFVVGQPASEMVQGIKSPGHAGKTQKNQETKNEDENSQRALRPFRRPPPLLQCLRDCN